MAPRYYQHGDVLIVAAELPAASTLTPARDGLVLARGEVTGHAHRVAGPEVEAWEDAQGTLWLRVGAGGGTVTHEEHGVGVVEPGTYRIDRVQEYDHFAEEARRVAD